MKKFVVALALVLLFVGGFVAYRSFSAPAPVPQLSSLPPKEQAQRRAEAQQLTTAVDEIARAAKKGERRDFTLSATQDQLNTLLQDKLDIKNAPVSDLSAQLQPGQIILSGRAKTNGLSVPAVITGDLKARDGGLVLEINSLKLGGFKAPGKVKQQAQKAASDALEKALSGGQKLRFGEVKIEREKLTVSGQTG